MESNIFVKQSEIKKNNVLSKKEIINSIPQPVFKNRDQNLSKINIEWRWRFFKIPNKKNEVVEISYKHPDQKRKYINQLGEWVEKEISSEFDQFVIDEYYHYNNITQSK